MSRRVLHWTPMTLKILEAYMRFMILIGLVKLPSIYNYWRKDEVFNFFAVVSWISRKCFIELHRYLHFVDNDTLPQPGQDNYDTLGKVRPIINILTSNFSATYEFWHDVSIDEAMIPFKDHSTLKQYMPEKPVKHAMAMSTILMYTQAGKETTPKMDLGHT